MRALGNAKIEAATRVASKADSVQVIADGEDGLDDNNAGLLKIDKGVKITAKLPVLLPFFIVKP